MAAQGNLFLDIAGLISTSECISDSNDSFQEALYQEYKNAYKISNSNYYKGEGADAFKTYLTNGCVNFLTGMMDISDEIKMFTDIVAEVFYQYENGNNHRGLVDEGCLDYINGKLDSFQRVFDESRGELINVTNAASQYISVLSLNFDSVSNGYDKVRTKINDIRHNLYDMDSEAKTNLLELKQRIESMNSLISKTMGFCYDQNGNIDKSKMKDLESQAWYERCSNAALTLKLKEDPFSYEAGETTIAEDQWAIGLCSDVYAYAGYSIRKKSYEYGVEDGTAFAKGLYRAVEANAYAQFTDYLVAKGEARVLYANGEAKIGLSDKYKGFRVEAEVGLVDIEGKVILGSENFNAFAAGEVKVLTADGKCAFEFEEDGQFAMGFDGGATVASAKAKAGFSFLSYKVKDSATKYEKNLFSISGKAGVDAGGEAALWAESETAIEFENFNVNTYHGKVKLDFLLAVEAEITMPYIYIKNPIW